MRTSIVSKPRATFAVDTPVHEAFGLSYSAYFCVPRLVLEHMPVEWQRQFIALVNRLPVTPAYECRLRDALGRYVGDELRDYRYGKLPEQMRLHIASLGTPS
jgi:hypothetical protein